MNPADGTAHETLEAVVEAFENAWNGPSIPDVERYLPALDHPDYDSIVCELVCVDFEHHWRSGESLSVEQYRLKHPSLVARQPVFEQLVFEDYRRRIQRGETIILADYAKAYGVSTDGWPRPPATEAETDAVVGKVSTVDGCDTDGLTKAVQMS